MWGASAFLTASRVQLHCTSPAKSVVFSKMEEETERERETGAVWKRKLCSSSLATKIDRNFYWPLLFCCDPCLRSAFGTVVSCLGSAEEIRPKLLKCWVVCQDAKRGPVRKFHGPRHTVQPNLSCHACRQCVALPPALEVMATTTQSL